MMTHLEINLNFNDLDYCVCLFVKPLCSFRKALGQNKGYLFMEDLESLSLR